MSAMKAVKALRAKLTHRQIDRLENILIALLVVSALVLIQQSGTLQNILGQETGTVEETLFTGVQDTALSRQTPVRLVVASGAGRWGIQYDQETVESWYSGGLDELLTTAVDAMESVRASSREEWQQILTQDSGWVYYDFLYNVAFTADSGNGEGEGRLFLLTSRNNWVDAVYYYNEETGDYYVGSLRNPLSLPPNLDTLIPNGTTFAFEDSELSELLAPYVLVLAQPPQCPIYTVSNPLADWDEETRQTLLEALDFNLRTSAIYESGDGLAIQEGSDTLRLQKNGKLTFHAAESDGEARFQALSTREKDLQITAEEILTAVTGSRLGEGRLLCQTVEEEQEEGSVILTYCCLLNGTQVQLGEDGWSARFVFEGSRLTGFTIYLRTYTSTGETQRALPERQAAAAASAMGQTGRELQLCYLDDGSADTLTATWTVRKMPLS